MTELELAEKAIAGDHEALLTLIAQYETMFYRIAFSYVRNEQDALEAMQELTYKCLKHIRTVKSPSYLKTWMVRVLINICLSMKKKQSRIVLTNSFEEIGSSNDELFEMNDIVQKLTIEQQQLIHLKYIEDRHNQDIAAIQNIPEGTVKSRLHHTLKKLRKLLGEGGI